MLSDRLEEIPLLLEAHLMTRGPSRKFLRAAVERLQQCMLDGAPCPSKQTPAALDARETLARAHLWLLVAMEQDVARDSIHRAMYLLRQVSGGDTPTPRPHAHVRPAG